jgi:hypothetical protein
MGFSFLKGLPNAVLARYYGDQKKICHNLSEWCSEHPQGSVVAHWNKPESIPRKLPLTGSENLQAAFIHDREVLRLERYLAVIEKARILCPEGYIQLPDGSFAYDHMMSCEPFLTTHPAYASSGTWKFFKRRQFLAGAFFSLLSKHCLAYYHWMHDVLGQLYKVLDTVPDEVRFIVPRDLNGTHLELLGRLGLGDRLCYYDKGTVLEVEKLYYAPPPVITRFDEPHSATWLSRRLREAYGCSGEAGTKRIYISRDKAKMRRIVNETLLKEKILDPLGFEMIYAEDLPLCEQARLFAEAGLVMAPHGAAFTNLYFCGPGTQVVELFLTNESQTHYWSMCEALGLEYSCFQGIPAVTADDEGDPSTSRKNRDFEVDCDKLALFLHSLISEDN